MGGCVSKLEAPAAGQPDAGSVSSNARDVQVFLQSIGLDIYAVSFQLAGINSQQQLQYLTEYELNRVELVSHVPILPHHRLRILEASRNYVSQAGPPPAQPASMTAVQLFNAIVEESDEENAEGDEAEVASLQPHGVASTAKQQNLETAHEAGKQQHQDHSAADHHAVMQDHVNTTESQHAALECLPGVVQQQAGAQTVADSSALNMAATAAVQGPDQDLTGPKARLLQLLQPKLAKVKEPAAAAAAEAADVAVTAPSCMSAAVCDSAHDQDVNQCGANEPGRKKYQDVLQQQGQMVAAEEAAGAAAASESTGANMAHHQPSLLQRMHLGSWKSKKPSAAAAAGAAIAVASTTANASFVVPGLTLVTAAGHEHKQHAAQHSSGADTVAAAAEAAGESAGAGAATAGSSSAATTTAQHSGFLQLLQLKSWRAKGGAAADATPHHAAAGAVPADAGGILTAVIPLHEDTGQQQQQQQQLQQEFSAISNATGSAAAADQSNTAAVAAAAVDPSDTAAPQTAAAAAAQPSAPGPLTTNKTALPKGAKLPPMPQRRTAPNAWAELPNEVANMAYAFNAPLSVQPLPLPHTAAAHIAAAAPVAVGAWAELPGEVSSMSYAATAPVSHSASEPPQKACGMPAEAAAVQDALQIAGGSSSSHVLRGSLPASVLRYSSDPGSSTGYQQQQQQQMMMLTGPQRYSCSDSGQQQRQQALASSCSAASIAGADASHPPAQLFAMSSVRRGVRPALPPPPPPPPAAVNGALLDLPPSVQQLHETVMARLRAQGSASRSQQGALAAAAATMRSTNSSMHMPQVPAAVPYNLKAPCEMLPSPRSLLQQDKVKEVTVALVKELVSPREGNATLSRTVQCRQQDANNLEQFAAQHSRNGLIITSEMTSYSLPVQYSSAGMHTALSQEQQLLQQQYAQQQLPEAASVAPVAAVPEQLLRQQQQLAPPPQNSGLHTGSPALVANLSRVSITSSASVAGVHTDTPHSSRPGSRASDVSSIVARAKERAAARQQLMTPCAAEASQNVPRSQQLGSSTGAGATVPSTDAAAAAVGIAPAAAGGMLGVSVESSSRCLSEESSSSSGVSAAAAGAVGGEHAMRMLQDYRTIAELDAAIKQRVSQLSTTVSSVDAAPHTIGAAGSRSGRDGVSSSSRGGLGVKQGGVGMGSMAAAAAAESGVAAYETDIATRSDARVRNQQQQGLLCSGTAAAALAPGDDPGGHDVSSLRASVGLLGIKEALDNSFDAGQRSKATLAHGARIRNAAAQRASTTSSSSWHGRDAHVRQSRGSAVPTPPGYRNPFLSPSPAATPEPTAAAAAYSAQLQQPGSLQGLGWAGVCSSYHGGSLAEGGEGVNAAWGAAAVAAAPALAVASKGGVAGAAARAASAAVDERIKRIVLASRARAAAAGAVAAQ